MATQRFYNATDKLVNAFIMGTIIHGSGCSCAVGTLCNGESLWFSYWRTSTPLLREKSTEIIATTNYTPIEIFEIERLFEGREKSLIDGEGKHSGCNYGYSNDRDGFKGLCNVFDYMVSIEDWNEEEKGANIFHLLESANN